MTTPPVPQFDVVPLFDVGNPLLAQGPVNIQTGAVETPAGKTGVFTLRTGSTTLTIFLGEGDLRAWAGLLTAAADGLAGGGLVRASAADVAAVSQPLVVPRRR